MTDPRQPDVDEARRLFDTAERDGVALLPELLAADLCVLGAALQAVFDEPVWRSWLTLADVTRDKLVLDVLNGLAHRRLVDPPADEDSSALRVHAPLGLIMAARSRPAFVAVCSVGEVQRGAPRMYGIAEDGRGLRAVLAEQVSAERIGLGTGHRERLDRVEDRARLGNLNQIYKYALMSPGRAVHILASWLHPEGGHDVPGVTAPRRLDLYRHREGQPLTREQVTVTAGGDRIHQVSLDGVPQDPHQDLPALLAGLLIGGTRP
ncbi:MAG: hypothetical protein ACRDRI_16140 [Pseudonocardiaceae bacterium]